MHTAIGKFGKAIFNDFMTHRYLLAVPTGLASSGVMTLVGLNPSTATHEKLDPTLRRCVNLAKRYSCGLLLMTNLFALRSTDPSALLLSQDPVGPDNDRALIEAASRSELVVAAWGAHKSTNLGDRARRMATTLSILGPVYAIKLNADGSPGHPLYQRNDKELEIFREHKPGWTIPGAEHDNDRLYIAQEIESCLSAGQTPDH